MNKKLLNGILIVLVVVVFLVNPPLGMIFSLVFWIYLGFMVLKQKRLFHGKTDPELAKIQLKRLKKLSVVSGIFLLIAVFGIVMHNVRSGLSEAEETFYFFIGMGALYIMIFASLGACVLFLSGRQKPE